MKETFTLDGVTYEWTPEKEITLDQHGEIVSVLEEAGLLTDVPRMTEEALEAVRAGDALEGDLSAELSFRIVSRIYRSRSQAKLLASYARPVGQDWTREHYDRAVGAFRQIKGMEKIQAFQEALAQVVASFFASGLAVARSSRSSIAVERKSGTPAGPNSPTAAVPTSASSTS